MGSMRVYAERFRGSHDVIDNLLPTLDAADELIDALGRWLAWQMAEQQGGDELCAFVRDELRRDLRNAVVYLWLGKNAGRDEEMMARVAAYLHERGYFEADDLPVLLGAAGAFEAQDPAGEQRLFALIQRFAATRMGVPADEPIPASLDFLASVATANESLEAHRLHQIAKGELRRYATDDKEAEPGAAAEEPPAEVEGAAQLLTDRLVSFSIGSDTLAATLAVKVEPVWTNGKWDEDAGEISWPDMVLPDDKAIPAFCSAVWSEPNAAFQELHFGMVVLQGGPLCEYVAWRKALTASQAEEWDRFIATLRPDDTLVARLTEFRFATDPPPDEAESDEPEAKGHAARIIKEILAVVTDER